jgi:hypothetical protein
MIRFKRRGPTRQVRRARDEAVGAWDHLRGAATERARRIGDTSRRSKDAARERTSNAAMALRGQTPRSTVRKWLGIGLAAGAAIGAVGAAALGRRRNRPATPGTSPDTGVREKATAAVETVRERASTAAHRAATSARDTAAKLSEATKSRPDGNGHSRTSPAETNRQSRVTPGSTKK